MRIRLNYMAQVKMRVGTTDRAVMVLERAIGAVDDVGVAEHRGRIQGRIAA